MHQQGTGHARIDAADEECLELVDPQVDAHDLGSEVVVPDGDKGPARPRPRDVDRRVRGQAGDHHDQVVVARLRVEDQDADLRLGHGHAVGPAGEAPELEDRPDDDEMGRYGGHDQVEAPDLQGRQAEDETRDAGGEAGGRERRPEGPAELGA